MSTDDRLARLGLLHLKGQTEKLMQALRERIARNAQLHGDVADERDREAREIYEEWQREQERGER